MTNNDTLQQAIELARKETGIKIVTKFDSEYDRARAVYNARLDFYPVAIAYCTSEEHVGYFFKHIKPDEGYVVRSGGHHHEGMCAQSGSFVLDLSEMGKLEISEDYKYVTVDSGKALGEVNAALAQKKRVLPVGGCSTVRVGGLTHGGGWGGSYRYFGLTVDCLEQVTIVIPTGETLVLNKDGVIKGKLPPEVHDNGKSLFWAIRGGGGGNFGVVTEFRFKLCIPTQSVTSINLQWRKKHRLEIAKAWMSMNAMAEKNLTTACRLTVVDSESHENPAILLMGLYYGNEEDCRKALQPLYNVAEPWRGGLETVDVSDENNIARLMSGNLIERSRFLLSDQLEPLPAQAYAIQVGARSRVDRVITCELNGLPEPHKVSSSFPRGSNHKITNDQVAEHIEEYLEKYDEFENANTYISLHGMGGQGGVEPQEGTAYPWRDKTFMLQIQAWWLDPNDTDGKDYIEWAEGFRDHLSNYTEGSFINFPDKDIPLKTYYGDRFDQLKKVKYLYDKDEILRFDMGIPPK